MAVNFNPNLNFKQVNPIINEKVEQPTVKQVDTQDVVEMTTQEPKNTEKVSGFRNAISKIAKLFASIGEMTKASIKGLFYGAITTGTALAGFWACGSVPKAVQNKSIQALKSISTKGKVISAVAGLGVLAYHLIKGKLNANKRTATIDHEWRTGHNADKF